MRGPFFFFSAQHTLPLWLSEPTQAQGRVRNQWRYARLGSAIQKSGACIGCRLTFSARLCKNREVLSDSSSQNKTSSYSYPVWRRIKRVNTADMVRSSTPFALLFNSVQCACCIISICTFLVPEAPNSTKTYLWLRWSVSDLFHSLKTVIYTRNVVKQPLFKPQHLQQHCKHLTELTNTPPHHHHHQISLDLLHLFIWIWKKLNTLKDCSCEIQ